MTENGLTEEKRSELEEKADEYHLLGIDDKMRPHYCDAHEGLVWVMVDGEVAHVEEATVSEWAEYVKRTTGWRTLKYNEAPFSEWLATELRGGA